MVEINRLGFGAPQGSAFAGSAFSPTASVGGGGFLQGLTKLLQDPQFRRTIGGVAQGLDPKGIGGLLGGAAQALVQSEEAGEAIGAGNEQSNSLLSNLVNLLKGERTPAGERGVTQAVFGPGGAFNLKGDLSPEDFATDAQGNLSQGILDAINPSDRTAQGGQSGTSPASGGGGRSQQIQQGVQVSDIIPFF